MNWLAGRSPPGSYYGVHARFILRQAQYAEILVVALPLVLLSAAVQAGAPQPLHGSVRDQTGAVLQGARVELADEAGAVVATTTTDVRG
jgi:hypothetical protein